MTGIEADIIGRRIALHLRRNHWEGCHNILDYEEQKLLSAEPVVAIAELKIPLRMVNLLESHEYIYLTDMLDTNVFQLEKILGLGPLHTIVIARAVSDAFRKVREDESTASDDFVGQSEDEESSYHDPG